MILMRVSLLVGEEQVTKDLLSTRKSKEEREERADEVSGLMVAKKPCDD